ncbi:MAG: DUF1016 domain-containing protein [Candidatus Margulisiibacteriota bacterium]|nr:MAG: DUF1016 domain-containing protein [Candidatus Margulisiibacteriota bacterium]
MNSKPAQTHFDEIILMIRESRSRALRNVNTELIDLYWRIGEYISKKIAEEVWGKSIVENLAEYILKQEPDIKGFSSQNLWRTRQFFETYKENPKLSPLVREISWTNNMIIISRCKTSEEREFYLSLTAREYLSKRELERQINSGIFERTMLSDKKLSPVVRELPQNVAGAFKDTYIFEFLNLHDSFDEKSLQKALIKNLKDFILELGRDFTFMGEEYRLQVGNSDFFIDLLFYHRELQCLVAFELKVDKFKPEYLGQLEFYLEALDRDVKKSHENPSIGVLLCRDKDSEVVEYALSRSVSPALIADYETKLIPKALLQKKIHELFENTVVD